MTLPFFLKLSATFETLPHWAFLTVSFVKNHFNHISKAFAWSKTKVESFGPLSIAEQEAIKAYLQGQFSDGWGEGFSQREISIGEGERLFIHFYASEMDDENLLYTEDEFEQQLEQQEVELRL